MQTQTKRSQDEIQAEISEALDRVWYGRHCARAEDVAAGEPVDPRIWRGALASAEKMRAKYPDIDEPLSDFEWGMLNGKLSALRWAQGAPWEVTLDT